MPPMFWQKQNNSEMERVTEMGKKKYTHKRFETVVSSEERTKPEYICDIQRSNETWDVFV